MGMGKTLQVIALLWTLLKQGPSGSPAARKAVVVCPASLVRNWGAEFRKWLGSARLEPLLVESGAGEKGKDAKTLFEDWALPQQKRWRPAPSASPTLACSFVVGFCVVLGWKAVAAVARRNRARMVLVVAAARVAAPSERLGLVVLVAHPFTQYELRQLPPDVFVGCLMPFFCKRAFVEA